MSTPITIELTLFQAIVARGELKARWESNVEFLEKTKRDFPNGVRMVQDHVDTLREVIDSLERSLPPECLIG